MVDLGEFLSLSSETGVYLLDSHRPYSLVNIFGNAQLTIIDDGAIEDGLQVLQDAYEGSLLDADELQALEQSDSETEATATDGSDLDDPEETQDENADPTVRGNRPRLRTNSDKPSRGFKRECYQKMVEYYKQGSSYGSSVAHMLFNLADELAKASNDHLWAAILGITYQSLLELRPESAYERDWEDLREACLRANPAREGAAADGAAPAMNRDGLIRPEEEFRFMLMRHWTLFNSMFHSRYIASRLGVWREKGKRLLETFLVKMGVPLHQCTRDYSSMDMDFKESLPGRLARHAADFGIEECLFNSFVRDFGYILRLSASDAVYALMALVEAPSAESTSSALQLAELNVEPDAKQKEQLWVRNFYLAFDALDSSSTDKLRLGIRLAMKQQQVILHEASTIISHRQVRSGRRFRYVVLKHSADLAWLASHPVSLSKLALFLVEALRSTKQARLPLVLAAYQAQTQLYQVVATNGIRDSNPTYDGVNFDDEDHDEGRVLDQPYQFRNHFGSSFRQAAQQIRARVKHDGFETSVIEVNGDDLKQFLHVLQTIPIPRH